MNILKRKARISSLITTEFLGANIPKNLIDYLTIYCDAHAITKSFVLKTLVQEWVDSMQLTSPKETLIENVALLAFKSWKGTKKHYSKFILNLESELQRKGLGEYASKIIEIIENEKNKGESE